MGASLHGDWHYQFRIVVLGDAAVGKTALLRRYAEGGFGPGPGPTVGVEFYSRALHLPPGLTVKLQLWDTAGHERFRCITRSFYRNVVGVLLVFDSSNRSSFEHIPDWYREVTSVQGLEKAIFLLVGHKSDLQGPRRVPAHEAEELAASLGMDFVEASAKTNSNVSLAFDTLVSAIQRALQKGDIQLGGGWDGVKVVHKAQAPGPRRAEKAPGPCQC
ncbi:ras-related protein Rab-42 [Ornithorhynchus anatinus]|uniref:ras-related protein Rab-42 n=1 Tax=Ornithorhynchus anatinus TaxID=9258 RepID=UPI0010A7E689|nr:ras-related protein Rab-42 [Ornithorhynchus anatinus]